MILEKKCHYKAFTLLELLLTISVLAVGIVPVIRSMAIGMVADQVIEYQMTAVFLAQEKMEIIKDSSWQSLGDYALKRESVGEPFANYEWEVEIKDSDEDPNNLKTVTVTVYWDSKGTEQQVVLSTLLTNLTPET
ncbi:MAG TPA: prepilin-type N-terminal cleavage/methylation domain-containing protein [Candidatus Omnitrophota bacterium]|nr:prepilin-type N-terminal cleavage/methylation domain-containing protein [Candidatus Omnitrophota bacterium]